MFGMGFGSPENVLLDETYDKCPLGYLHYCQKCGVAYSCLPCLSQGGAMLQVP